MQSQIYDAIRILKHGCLPQECSVISRDHGDKINFRVYKSLDNSMFIEHTLSAEQFFDPSSLNWVIQNVRAELTRSGIKLEPWSFPVSK